jgi:esterase/lipase superfamily enzyme
LPGTLPSPWEVALPELSPPLAGVAVLAVAGCLYIAIWLATRGLGAGVRALARTLPVLAIVPGLVYLSVTLSNAREEAEDGPAPAARSSPAKRSSPKPPAAEAKTAAVPSSDRVEAADNTAAADAAATGRSVEAAEAGQAGAAAAVAAATTPAEKAEWDVVPVLYGTDRLRENDPKAARKTFKTAPKAIKRISYGAERARRLELGRALVTVPVAHKVPSIERPFALRVPYFNVVLYEAAEDPKRHFTVKELQVLPRDRFLALARARLGGSRGFKDHALVLVHGFNTGFDHALYRAAQIAYDLQFDGAVFLYSWPAGGGVLGYARDRESATQAEPYLKEFLSLVLQESGAKNVSVIAHSMGNLPLLNVLRVLGPSLPEGVRLRELILAAPDVDRDVFVNLIAAIKGYGRGITLYCSANDRAMIASRQVAGGVPRAGDVPDEGPLVIPGVDTIDVTETSTDLLALNHSTYAERSALLNDIGLILQTGERPPEKRVPILRKVSTAQGAFWRYP